jgi:hypothetical protein
MHGAADKGAGKKDRTDSGRSFTFIGHSTIKLWRLLHPRLGVLCYYLCITCIVGSTDSYSVHGSISCAHGPGKADIWDCCAAIILTLAGKRL